MSRTRRTVLVAIALLAVLTAFIIALVATRGAGPAGPERTTGAGETGQPAASASGGRIVHASRVPSGAPPGGSAPERTHEALRETIELARSGRFYLVLDPQAATLTLRFRGATARTWPLDRIEVGRRRILFVDSEPAGRLTGTVWTGARLEPSREEERPLLEVDSQGTPQGPEPPLIPPTPEEAVPAPPSYLIRFEEGLTVEVVAGTTGEHSKASGAEGEAEGIAGTAPAGTIDHAGSRLRDAWHALTRRAGTHPRLRLVLTPSESGSLYRSLGDGVALVVR